MRSLVEAQLCAAILICFGLALLPGCQPSAAKTAPAVDAGMLLDEIPATEGDEQVLLDAVQQPLYIAVRSPAELDALKQHLNLPDLFQTAPDFSREMVVGSVAEPAARQRDYRLYRLLYTPEALEVHLASYARKELDAPVTPYVFVRVPRADTPVRFFINGRPVAAEDAEPLTAGIHDRVLSYRMAYSVNVPPNIATPAPLLVFLHSSTSNGHRWAPNFTELAEKYGFVVLTPSARNGYFWTEDYDYPAILDAIEELKLRYPIDGRRIYAAGNSAGGHAVYDFALRHREVFRAFAASAGRLDPDVPDSLVESGKGMHVLILCGEQDVSVPIALVQAGKERLEKAGLDVTFRSYPVGHGVLGADTGAFEDMFRWLSLQAYGTEEPRH